MRFLWAVVAALLLAACQQPAGTTASPPPSSADQSSALSGLGSGGERGHLRFFKPEGDAMAKQLAVALLDACYGNVQIQDKTGFHDCLRDRLTDAFDDSRQGRRACGHYTEIDAYTDCVVVGNMVLDLRHRLDDDSPVPADFWTSKDSMAHAMIKSLMIGAAANCGSAPSEAGLLACADKWFAGRLDLPDDFMKRCDATSDDHARQGCLGEAASLQYIRSHLNRISKDTI
jgi:hypothetical protein